MSTLLQVGVKIFLENDKGKFLLLKRSSKRYPEIKIIGEWDIPGGRIIPGTKLFNNLKREVFEETKLEILGAPRLLGAQDILRRKEKHIVRLTYLGKVSGEPILDEEHTDFKWLTIPEMKRIEKLDEFTREIMNTNQSL